MDVKEPIWRQFGAAIDMIENAIVACPDDLWNDRSQRPEFWHVAYHSLFFLDLYLTGSLEGFAPPPPLTLNEVTARDEAPDEAYTKQAMLTYVEHCRAKCRATIDGLTDEGAAVRRRFPWMELSVLELLFYNARHVQHHAGQLNMLLRQKTGAAPPRWVKQAT